MPKINLYWNRIITLFTTIFLSTVSTTSFSWNAPGHPELHLGGFQSTQGQTQFSGIQGLVGNDFTVTQQHGTSFLVGAGYYLEDPSTAAFDLALGLDVFYLSKTTVKGNVMQERLFKNLSYQYSISHLPIYAAAKATMIRDASYTFTFNFGLGPNFISTSNFQEHSLDGVTLPEDAFSSQRHTALSAMAGVGVKINHAFGQAPLECGYRFFYLGQGELRKNYSQISSNLKTGQNYANALMCSVIL